MSKFENVARQDARLIILKALAQETDETLPSSLIEHWLMTFGITRERAWVHEEIKWLAQMGAVTFNEAGSVFIVTLAEKGARHLARTANITGINRPSRPV